MAITYSLAPNPKWYIADLVGKPLGAGYLATFSSQDHTLLNPVFTDASGLFPWPYVTIPNVGSLGILFDENGSQGPFYFKFNSATPNVLYYLEVYDYNGVLQWTIDNFTPGTGGGGSVITTAINLENLVANSVMYRNMIGTSPVSASIKMKLAPGANAGLADTVSNAGPDIYFLKNNASATDSVSFPLLTLGTSFNSDVAPVNYLNYTCGIAGSAETSKLVQFPITQGVQNLSNQAMTVSIWARTNAGATSITLSWRQFFGDGGGASPGPGPIDLITPIQTITTLTAQWQKFVFQTPIPDTTGGTLGVCGNDGLFLQVQYPLDATCNIDITKASVYLGNIAPTADYDTYDMIDAVMNTPRTGFITQGYQAPFVGGWILMDDGSIGKTGSAASNRPNNDTFPLYNLLYTNVINTWAPVSGGRTGDAVADFVAGKTLTLPLQLGRVLGTAGSGAGLTTRAIGQNLGSETHVLSITEMPTHTHPTNAGAFYEIGGGGATADPAGGGTSAQSATTGPSGSGAAHTIMQPSSFIYTYIKL